MCLSVLKMFLIISWISMSRSHNDSALRIIGGKDAEEEKYPYIVRLQCLYKILTFNVTMTIHVCTGALITPTWTITAAHCIDGRHITEHYEKTPYLLVGKVSEVFVNLKDSMRNILKSFTHPRFSLGTFTLRNDIALIKSEAVTLINYARLSALDTMTMIGLESTATGYGITNISNFVDDATTLQKPLQTLDVIVVKCMEEMRSRVYPQLCVARRCGRSAGVCPGDSGGPLLHSSGILGVNSCGPKNTMTFCALKTKEPVYDVGIITPVAPFIDWIKSTIEKN